MAVKVRIPAPLRGLTGGKGEVDVAPGSVSEVLSGLDKSFAGIRSKICEESGEVRRYVRLFLNDEDVRGKGGLKAAVKDGDVLSIIPAIAGGTA
jgi:molybdopterin synthase sulfur carrier subunit